MKHLLNLVIVGLLLVGCSDGNSVSPNNGEEEKVSEEVENVIGTWEVDYSNLSADWVGDKSKVQVKRKGPFDDVEWDTLVYSKPDSLNLYVEKTNDTLFTFIYESNTIASKEEVVEGQLDYYLDSPFITGDILGGSYHWVDGKGIVIRSDNPFYCDRSYSFDEGEVIQYKIAKPYTDTTFNRVYQFKVSGLIETAEEVMGCG